MSQRGISPIVLLVVSGHLGWLLSCCLEIRLDIGFTGAERTPGEGRLGSSRWDTRRHSLHRRTSVVVEGWCFVRLLPAHEGIHRLLLVARSLLIDLIVELVTEKLLLYLELIDLGLFQLIVLLSLICSILPLIQLSHSLLKLLSKPRSLSLSGLVSPLDLSRAFLPNVDFV